jgi:hypothetical protein
MNLAMSGCTWNNRKAPVKIVNANTSMGVIVPYCGRGPKKANADREFGPVNAERSFHWSGAGMIGGAYG